MKKTTFGIVAVVALLLGCGAGCPNQPTQPQPQPPAVNVPAPAPTPAPTPAPAAGATLNLSEADNGTTVHATVGDTVDLVLHRTYWQLQPTDSAVLKPLASEPTVTGTLSHPPGMGTGTVEMKYQVAQAGTADITASRTTCGEALRCTGTQGEYKVTLIADAAVAQPPVNAPLVGGDRDSHGCIGSAGYSWCASKAKCLRPWEEKCDAPTTVLVSTEDATKYCNGADMDTDGFRKTVTEEQPFTPAPANATEADRIREVLAAATTGMCKTAVTSGDVIVTGGVAHMPPIDGWAGVSIVMCSCKPLVEENLLRLPGITSVVWDASR